MSMDVEFAVVQTPGKKLDIEFGAHSIICFLLTMTRIRLYLCESAWHFGFLERAIRSTHNSVHS